MKEKERERTLVQCNSCSEVNMKRTFSLDSFTTSMSKVEESNEDSRQESGGRGWSRFIGDQPCWTITTDSDVTDFAIGKLKSYMSLRRFLYGLLVPSPIESDQT